MSIKCQCTTFPPHQFNNVLVASDSLGHQIIYGGNPTGDNLTNRVHRLSSCFESHEDACDVAAQVSMYGPSVHPTWYNLRDESFGEALFRVFAGTNSSH